MALDRLTKVDGGGISTTSDYRVGIITATKFVGPIEGDVTGSITATDGTFSGNVTIGGTLTYEDVTNIDSVGIITARNGIDCNGDIDVDGHTNLDNVSVAGVTTFASNVNLGDNDKIIFGSGNRFQIYDNGTSAIIDNSYGGGSILRLGSGNQVVLGSPLSNNQNLIRGVVNGPAELYHAGAKKLETYASGINVTGNTVADGLTIDGDSDLNGDLDVDGHTELDNVRISGIASVHNTLRYTTTGGAHIDHGTTNQNLNFRVSKSSTADTTMMQINAAAEQTKFRKVVTVGFQGGSDTTVIGGGSGIGAYLQLNYASGGIVNTKLLGNGNSWLNSHYGNLGIGTQTPQAKFVVSNAGANGFEFNPNFNSNNSIIASYNRTGGGSYSQLTLSASQHIFAQGGTEYARFNADGNLILKDHLGQGNSLVNLIRANDSSGNSQYQLGMVSSGNQDLYLENSKNANIRFRTSGSTRWKIDGDPGHLLPEVAGAVNTGSATAEIGDVYIADDKKVKFGSFGFQMYQNTSSSNNAIIEQSASGQFLRLITNGGALNLESDYINLRNSANSADVASFDADGAATLRHNSNIKLTTTTTGISVTGEVASSQDYPNFQPTFDANFAASRTLDPRFTFQRVGPASFVNEFGKVVLVGENVPRFDHDLTTRESLGILIEQARTNFMKYSDEFAIPSGQTGGNWDSIGGTSDYTRVSDTTETKDPTGITNRASKLTFNSGNATLRGYWYSGAVDGATAKTFSVYLKRATSNTTTIQIDIGDQGTASYTITDEWKRYSVTTSSAGNGNFVDMRLQTGASTPYYAWGAQIEAGSYATSYIPTSSAAVTRGADILDVDGEDFTDFYNQTESTIISSHTLLTGVPNAENVYVYQIQDASTNNAIRVIDKNTSYSNVATGLVISGGSSQFHFNNTTDSFTKDKVLVALSVKQDDFAGCHNGGTIETDNSGTLPTNFNALGIGRYPPSSGYELNGHIQRFIYYPKQLSDSQLKTLTS